MSGRPQPGDPFLQLSQGEPAQIQSLLRSIIQPADDDGVGIERVRSQPLARCVASRTGSSTSAAAARI